MIIAWFGKINNIPQNWALFNGENGTPDLTNKFILGVCEEKKILGKQVENLLLNLKEKIFLL